AGDSQNNIDFNIIDNPGITEDFDIIDDFDINEINPQDSRDPNGIYYNKKVYLTFDDGPTKNTDLILDILADYNIKATFFVIGQNDDISKERYKRIVDEGHTLGMHSYSHKYNELYKSIEDFDKDFTKLWKLLYDTTGYTATLYRFPGGSLNFTKKSKIEQFSNYLSDKGMTYYDWNVVNGDGEGINYSEEQMIENVLSGVARKKTSIVLMHDGQGKSKTVATLPKILDALISGGAEVLPMDETVPLIQQIKATSVK
ncbi:MAG: polysaccharide deacetylase, partial [Anaerolineaceae bacterium]